MSGIVARGVRHAGIVVKNLDAVSAFYRDGLGMRVRSDATEEGPYIEALLGVPGARVRTLKLEAEDGSTVELLRFDDDAGEAIEERRLTRPGHTHVAFRVDEVDAAWKRLRAIGTRFVSEPQSSPDGYARVVFCRDPEGNFVELVQVMKTS